MSAATPDDLAVRIARLPASQQRQALAFVSNPERAADPTGLLVFAGTIPLEDLAAMTEAIEAECEQVDASK